MIDSVYKWRHVNRIGWERIRTEGDVKVEASEASVPNGYQSSWECVLSQKESRWMDEETGAWLQTSVMLNCLICI